MLLELFGEYCLSGDWRFGALLLFRLQSRLALSSLADIRCTYQPYVTSLSPGYVRFGWWLAAIVPSSILTGYTMLAACDDGHRDASRVLYMYLKARKLLGQEQQRQRPALINTLRPLSGTYFSNLPCDIVDVLDGYLNAPCSVVAELANSFGYGLLGQVHSPRSAAFFHCLKVMCTGFRAYCHREGSQQRWLSHFIEYFQVTNGLVKQRLFSEPLHSFLLVSLFTVVRQALWMSQDIALEQLQIAWSSACPALPPIPAKVIVCLRDHNPSHPLPYCLCLLGPLEDPNMDKNENLLRQCIHDRWVIREFPSRIRYSAGISDKHLDMNDCKLQ